MQCAVNHVVKCSVELEVVSLSFNRILSRFHPTIWKTPLLTTDRKGYLLIVSVLGPFICFLEGRLEREEGEGIWRDYEERKWKTGGYQERRNKEGKSKMRKWAEGGFLLNMMCKALL